MNLLPSLCRQASVNAMQRLAGLGYKLEEVDTRDDFVYGHHMTLMMVECPSFGTLIKIHYTLSNANAIRATSSGTSSIPIDRNAAKAFVGQLLHEIVQEYVSYLPLREGDTLASLPFVIRGFDEVYFSDEKKTGQIDDYWSLVGMGQILHITSSIIPTKASEFADFVQRVSTQTLARTS